MKKERMIVLDWLRHRSILTWIVFDFWVFCALHGEENDCVRRGRPIFDKVCAGEPVTAAELQDLLSLTYHSLLRPLKLKLAQLEERV
ncbi:MAG: hypothetical protein FJ044_01860 [Candidatus Cloacimonetes bacterium]|nr:hypothetical protein [Candidatus Cloacimonadota bacterium]